MNGLLFWRLQRSTALVLFVYLLFLVPYLFMGYRLDLDYMGNQLIISIVFLSIFFHAKMGTWTVITDYIPSKMQLFSNILVNLYLTLMFIWVIMIVWF